MRICVRILLFPIVSAIMFTLFIGSSCDKGTESKEEGTIIGTWRLNRVKVKDTPVGDLKLTAENFLGMSGTGATSSTLRINEDGTASVLTTYTDGSEDEVGGTWMIDGDMLVVEGAGIDDTIPFDLDGNTLTLTLTLPIDFYSDGTPEDTEVDFIYRKA